jgi:hypothetical protein
LEESEGEEDTTLIGRGRNKGEKKVGVDNHNVIG